MNRTEDDPLIQAAWDLCCKLDGEGGRQAVLSDPQNEAKWRVIRQIRAELGKEPEASR